MHIDKGLLEAAIEETAERAFEEDANETDQLAKIPTMVEIIKLTTNNIIAQKHTDPVNLASHIAATFQLAFKVGRVYAEFEKEKVTEWQASV